MRTTPHPNQFFSWNFLFRKLVAEDAVEGGEVVQTRIGLGLNVGVMVSGGKKLQLLNPGKDTLSWET